MTHKEKAELQEETLRDACNQYEHKLEIQLGHDGKYYVFYDNELCKCCKDSKSIRKYVKEHYDVDLNYAHIRGGKLVGIMCETYWIK